MVAWWQTCHKDREGEGIARLRQRASTSRKKQQCRSQSGLALGAMADSKATRPCISSKAQHWGAVALQNAIQYQRIGPSLSSQGRKAWLLMLLGFLG